MKVCSKMGISTIQSYHGAQVFEAIGLNQPFVDEYFTWTASRVEGIGIDEIADEVKQRHLRAFPDRPLPEDSLDPGGQYQYRRNGEFHLFNPESIHKLQYACRTGDFKVFKEYSRLIDDQSREPLHAARSHGHQVDTQAGADRGGRADRGDSQALQDRRHVVRVDQQGGARDAGDRDEPHRRQEQHGRGRRGSRALRPRRQRRLAPERHQAGRLRSLRRHQPLPGQRRRDSDQDGPGREAGRRRAAPRQQGLSLDRQGPLLDAGRGADLAAAAPRHLFDRGSGAADPRPQERQPARAHQRQAGGRGGRRDHRRRRRQGARRSGAHQRARRRHGRVAAHQPQARRRPLGARPGRDAPGAGAQQPAQPDRRRDRRPAQDRPRRGDRRAARGRGVRLLDGAAGRRRLHHDAGLSPQHLPGGRGDAESRAAQEVHRLARPRGQLHAFHRHRGARADGAARLPHDERDDRPHRAPGDEVGGRTLEGARARPVEDLVPAVRRSGGRSLPDAGAGPRARSNRST